MDAIVKVKCKPKIIRKSLLILLLSIVILPDFVYGNEGYNPIFIVPGRSVGEFTLGENNVKKIVNKFGKGKIKKVEYKNKPHMAFLYDDLGLIYYFDYETKLLSRIDVFSTGLHVSGSKIHVGSDIEKVKSYFGEKVKVKDELIYEKYGISFQIREELKKKTVSRISVFSKEN